MIKSIDEALNIIGQQIVDSMREELAKQRPGGKINASGNLSRSIKYEVVDVGDNLAIWINYDDYGDVVDKGRSASKRGGPNQTWRSKIS